MKKIIFTALTTSLTLCALTFQANAQASDPSKDRRFDYHRAAKHYMYGTLMRQTARNVTRGRDQPLLKFAVLDSPQSLFINFEVLPEMEDALVEHLGLPEGFALAPIAILEGEEPKLYITLNIYAVDGLQGLLSGTRGEWSVYVKKNGGRTSFMVIDARSEKLTLDSVNWFTFGTKVTHQQNEEGGYDSFVASDKRSYFQSQISATGLNNAELKETNPSWISANDRVYWRDGVADRTYYDGDFVDTPVLDINPAALTFTDTTVWSLFVAADPVSVLMYEEGFELVISPWYNLDSE